MKRPTKYVRKAGAQIPRHVAKMMARLHPTVSILWHLNTKRWCLVQRVKGRDYMIRLLEKNGQYAPPTLANTVYVLNSSHPSRLRSKAARERFLDQLDANPQRDYVKKRSRGMVADGSRDLWNALNNRIVVPKPA